MWIYIGDKSYKGLKTYRCSACCCMVHVESVLPEECPNCGKRNVEMKNMEPHQMINKLVEERDEALAKAERLQKHIDGIVEQIHEYFKGELDNRTDEMGCCSFDFVDDILKHNKAVCKIVRGE